MGKEFFIMPVVAADKVGYEFLCELYDEMYEIENTDICINFAKCKSFDANLSAVLGAIFDKRQSEGCNIFLGAPKVAGVRRALSRNKFFRAFDLDTTYEDRENYIEYHKFGVADTKQFKQYIDTELVQKKRFPECTEKAKIKIIESIYEIFANAASHGGCSHVYSCGEVHTYRNKTMLDMTFVNLGLSVVDNVSRYMDEKGKPTLTSCEALNWAFVEGNTTKEITGGLGLAILKQFVSMNEGSIQMISGNAMLEIEGDNHSNTCLDKCFQGTIVTVKFNCDDSKTYLMTDEVPDTKKLF
jgi:hypothetical protein